MREMAIIRMFAMDNGSPGVQLQSEDGFFDMQPMDRAIMLNAALHLCVAAINAIADDHPDDADDIMETLAHMSIAPNKQVQN